METEPSQQPDITSPPQPESSAAASERFIVRAVSVHAGIDIYRDLGCTHENLSAAIWDDREFRELARKVWTRPANPLVPPHVLIAMVVCSKDYSYNHTVKGNLGSATLITYIWDRVALLVIKLADLIGRPLRTTLDRLVGGRSAQGYITALRVDPNDSPDEEHYLSQEYEGLAQPLAGFPTSFRDNTTMLLYTSMEWEWHA